MELPSPLVRAGVVLALTFGGCAMRKLPGLPLDRPAICLIGGLLTVALGVLDLDQAYAAIDLRVIALLLGMMIAAGGLAEAGLYARVAQRLGSSARSRPRRLLWLVLLAAGGLSAIVTNDTVCVFFAPLLIVLCRAAGRRPMPFLIALALASNTGSAATLVGNPQNVYIGNDAALHVKDGTSHLDFVRYLLLATPVALAGLAASYAAVAFVYRADLDADPGEEKPSLWNQPYDPVLAKKSVGVLVLAGVLLVLKVDLSLAALVAAAAILIISDRDPRVFYHQIDVGLLMLFGGLFVVTKGAHGAGVIEALRGWFAPDPRASFPSQAIAMSSFTVVGSQLVSNVPFVLATTSWLPGLAAPDGHRVLLALVSTFAGNLTVLGSVANLIVIGAARRDEPIGFFEHLKTGLPVTFVQVVLAVTAVVIYQRLGLT